VSERFWSRITKTWRYKLHTQVMREKSFSPALVKDLMDKIRTQIGESAKAGPLGKLEGKLSLWKSQDDNLLNTLHQELYQYESPQRDNDRLALSAEAHTLRFAASASAGIKSFNPTKGEIDVGVKCEAAFSLAEGCVGKGGQAPFTLLAAPWFVLRNGSYQPMNAFRIQVQGSFAILCWPKSKASQTYWFREKTWASKGPCLNWLFALNSASETICKKMLFQ